MHVLGTPPALILSQDQTLRKKFSITRMQIYEVKKNWALYTFCHSSIVKVPFSKRAKFYQPRSGLSRPIPRQKTDISFPDIGTSDQQAFYPEELWSLTLLRLFGC